MRQAAGHREKTKVKLNLKCGNDIRPGYVNIDCLPLGQISPDMYRQGDTRALDWLTEDETVDEILALDCLEYLPTKIVGQSLTNWAQKLITGGVIKILIPDCHAVAKAFAQGQFSLQEYSQIIFGTQETGDSRCSVMDTATLLSFLQEIGLTVILKRYEGVAIYVEAVK